MQLFYKLGLHTSLSSCSCAVFRSLLGPQSAYRHRLEPTAAVGLLNRIFLRLSRKKYFFLR